MTQVDADFTFSPYKRGIAKKSKTESPPVTSVTASGLIDGSLWVVVQKNEQWHDFTAPIESQVADKVSKR